MKNYGNCENEEVDIFKEDESDFNSGLALVFGIFISIILLYLTNF